MTTHNWQTECIFPAFDGQHVAVHLYCSIHKHRRAMEFRIADSTATMQEMWTTIMGPRPTDTTTGGTR